MVKKVSCLIPMLPNEVKQGNTKYCFSSHSTNKCSSGRFSVMVFAFVCVFFFFLVTLLFQMACKHSPEVLCGVPTAFNKAVMHVMEKMCVPGMSYSIAGHEFNIKETLYIKSRHEL